MISRHPRRRRGIGEVCIADTQARVHASSEAVAVAVMAPFMLWLSTQENLTPTTRKLLVAGAVSSIFVDGILLWQYRRLKEKK